MKKLSLVIVLISVAGLSGCRHHHFNHEALKEIDRSLAQAGVSEADRAKIEPIFKKAMPAFAALDQEHSALHAELVSEWSSPTPDRAKLDQRVDSFADALRRAGHEGVGAIIELSSMLDSGQKKKLLEHVMAHEAE